MFVVAIGNPFDGINLFGPFNSVDDANDWAANVKDEWLVVEIQGEL